MLKGCLVLITYPDLQNKAAYMANGFWSFQQDESTRGIECLPTRQNKYYILNCKYIHIVQHICMSFWKWLSFSNCNIIWRIPLPALICDSRYQKLTGMLTKIPIFWPGKSCTLRVVEKKQRHLQSWFLQNKHLAIFLFDLESSELVP